MKSCWRVRPDWDKHAPQSPALELHLAPGCGCISPDSICNQVFAQVRLVKAYSKNGVSSFSRRDLSPSVRSTVKRSCPSAAVA